MLWIDGVVKCWGDNAHGQLGLGDTIRRGKAPGEMGAALPALPVAAGAVVKAIAAAGDRTCITLGTDEVQCFGTNASGELGLDSVVPVHAPGTRAPAGAMSRGHTCSRAVDAVRCWGDNAFGQLGVGDTASRGDNVGEMAALAGILPLGAGLVPPAAISSGAVADHTCMTWSEPPPGVPNPAPNAPGWQTRVACWGKNDKGQLGLGDTTHRGDHPGQLLALIDHGSSATIRPGNTTLQAVTGGAHTCLVIRNRDYQSMKCWGDNARGQLGLGDTASRGDDPGEMGDLLPTHQHFTPSDGRFGDPSSPNVSLGRAHTCALSYAWGNRLGVVQCWGAGDAGQLGRGEAFDRGGAPGDAYPIIDLGTNLWVANRGSGAMYAAGGDHVCAVVQEASDAVGTPLAGSLPTRVHCWGKNDKGQLGLGDQANRGDQPGEMGDALPFVRLR